jgi:hypothetical protein
VLLTGANIFLPFAWDSKSGLLQRRRRGRKQPTVKPWVGLMKEIHSARGLAHSKTLRAVRSSPGKRASVLECGGPPPLFHCDAV